MSVVVERLFRSCTHQRDGGVNKVAYCPGVRVLHLFITGGAFRLPAFHDSAWNQTRRYTPYLHSLASCWNGILFSSHS